MPRLLLATNNAGKLREIRSLLEPHGWTVVTPTGLGLRLDPEENGASYAENAAIKAAAFTAASGLASMADDSGLEIAALDGRPGIHSARYGGPGASDADRVQRLLVELRDTPTDQRTARFCCAIVIETADGRRWQTEGSCAGRIAAAPRGHDGFGYDPIFLLDGRDQTMAEIGEAEKNTISHRAIAVRKAVELLQGLRDDPAFS